MTQPRDFQIARRLREMADEIDGGWEQSKELKANPEGSIWVRSLVAKMMDLPDAEFVSLANKVITRYQQAMDDLAPPGVLPASHQESP